MSQSVPIGYSDVPRGHIASVVTDAKCCPSRPRPSCLPEGITLTPASRVSLDAYRALVQEVGADWLWFSRLFMADEELAATLGHPDVDIRSSSATERTWAFWSWTFAWRTSAS